MAPILELINPVVSSFTLEEALVLLRPLILFILGVAIYSLFIFKFYRFVARREIFSFDLKKYAGSSYEGFKKFTHTIFHFLKYIFVFPVLTFFWFIVLSMILAFLSKQSDMQTILLISIALVSVIRIMAYYNEDLSKDLAKMLPFALLGVFLVDISYFSVSDSINSILQLPLLWKSMIYYLVFIILLEFILRIIFNIWNLFSNKKTAQN